MEEFDDMLKALDRSTMVTITDADGKLLYVNKLFCDVTKYSKEELVGKKPNELLNSNFHDQEFYDDIWNTLKKGDAWKGDIKNKAKDGSFFWTLTTIMPFLDENNKPCKFIAIRRDITEKVEADQRLKVTLAENVMQKDKIQDQYVKLQDLQKEKEEFVAMITHDLKQPLVPISALVDEEFDLPLKINQNAFPLGSNENTIQTQTINIGEPIRFEMVFYEDSELEHVSIYLNIRDNQRADQSDTQILFNRDKPLEIIDKNSFFENVSVEIIETEDGIKIAVFEITFAKEMETSDLIYKSWDFSRRGTEIMVHDAIQIPPIVEDIPTEEKPTEIVVIEKKPVPDWVKSNAKWWAEGGIDDKTFTNGIGFLISEKIIDIQVEANVSKDKDDESIEEEETVQVNVPQWVKANAEWWANDQIDEGTFLSGIEYMVRNGIITMA